MHSQLLGCCTARGFSTRFFLVGLTKFEARKSFLFAVKFPYVENKKSSPKSQHT